MRHVVQVYVCRFRHPVLGVMLSWHRNKREATAHLGRMQRGQGPDFAPAFADGVDQIDVPRSKDELIGWLNANLFSER